MLADTSVWVDLLRQKETVEAILLQQKLLQGDIVMGDLNLVEILNGVRNAADERAASAAFGMLPCKTLCGPDIAPIAAANYRKLRQNGITIRGTIDVIIATWCIENGAMLLHNDRDFGMMEEVLGLTGWRG